jgi:hypothetical protein
MQILIWTLTPSALSCSGTFLLLLRKWNHLYMLVDASAWPLTIFFGIFSLHLAFQAHDLLHHIYIISSLYWPAFLVSSGIFLSFSGRLPAALPYLPSWWLWRLWTRYSSISWRMDLADANRLSEWQGSHEILEYLWYLWTIYGLFHLFHFETASELYPRRQSGRMCGAAAVTWWFLMERSGE